MKGIKLLSLFLLLVLITGACNKKEDDDGDINPITLYTKITGTWYPDSLLQVDEIAKASGNELYQMDLTGFFGFSDLEIRFNLNEEEEPTTFEVTGDAPELFLFEGYWDLENPFPTTAENSTNYIRLYDDESKTKVADLLELVTVPGEDKILVFRLVRSSSGTAYVSYNFTLKTVNDE